MNLVTEGFVQHTQARPTGNRNRDLVEAWNVLQL